MTVHKRRQRKFMEAIHINEIPIYYPSEERLSAELLCRVIEKTDQLMIDLWGLSAPDDCRVYVMTSWQDFLAHAPPKNWQILIKLFGPILCPRFNRIWPYVGGWEQRFGKLVAVGVKSPELIQDSDTSVGEEIFDPVNDVSLKFQLTACHELTHAYSTHLVLPAWLKEGIAMVSVDRYHESQTVRQETLETLSRRVNNHRPGGYRRIRGTDPNQMIYFYARSYWITRFIEETRPGLLMSLFDKRYRHKELETRLAAAYHMTYEEFWETANQRIIRHFTQRRQNAFNQ